MAWGGLFGRGMRIIGVARSDHLWVSAFRYTCQWLNSMDKPAVQHCRAGALARSKRLPDTDQIMRRLKILHRTYYKFRGLVQLQPHRLLLRPREGAGLHIEWSKLDIEPAAQLRWVRDAYDNSVAVATFGSPIAHLGIVSECMVQQFDETPLDFLVADFVVNYPFTYDADTAEVLRRYLRSLPQDEQAALGAWVHR
jgi:hypothetical protein